MIPASFKKFKIHNKEYDIVDLSNLTSFEDLPFSYRILVENIIRQNLLGRNNNASEQVKSIIEG